MLLRDVTGDAFLSNVKSVAILNMLLLNNVNGAVSDNVKTLAF